MGNLSSKIIVFSFSEKFSNLLIIYIWKTKCGVSRFCDLLVKSNSKNILERELFHTQQ